MSGGASSSLTPGAGWPNSPIAIPPIAFAVGGVEVINDELHWRRTEFREAEPELAIREVASLDAASMGPADCANWMERHGLVLYPAVPGGPYATWARAEDWYCRRTPGRLGGLIPFEDVRRVLFRAQKLAAHLVSVRRGLDPTEVWHAAPPAVSDEVDAGLAFVRILNDELKRFTVRVHADWVQRFPGKGSSAADLEMSSEIGSVEFDAVSAVAAQLHNLWVDDEVPIRTCEHCGNTFSHQQGRAKQGQHRSRGVIKYCTENCAKNAGQQRRRRAQSTKKD